MGIVPIHEWKVPLKFRVMLLFQIFPSGPLGLGQAADTMVTVVAAPVSTLPATAVASTTASIIVVFDPMPPPAMAVRRVALALTRSFSFSVAVVRIFSSLAASPTRPRRFVSTVATPPPVSLSQSHPFSLSERFIVVWAGRTESDVVDIVISSRIVVILIASPSSLEVVEGVSGGLQRQTSVLVGRGENLTRRVGTLLLMTAEELPSSRCFCAVCDIFFPAGSGKLTILALQSHARVISPCNCVAKTASSPQQWGDNNIAGVNLG
jgi:hypothetical protein